MVLLSAGDTGAWGQNCDNASDATASEDPLRLGAMPDFNCSAWDPPTLGTLDHFDHLILPNYGMLPSSGSPTDSLAQRAIHLFNFSAFSGTPYAERAPIGQTESYHYLEADLMGVGRGARSLDRCPHRLSSRAHPPTDTRG